MILELIDPTTPDERGKQKVYGVEVLIFATVFELKNNPDLSPAGKLLTTGEYWAGVPFVI